MNKLEKFNPDDIVIVNNAVAMAEELVSNFYKMSQREWLNNRYDVKTMKDLDPGEIVHGPFAQIIRYEGKKKDTFLGSSAYDFYKICLQDDSILSELKRSDDIELFPFILYIIIHELIHIVRFSKFFNTLMRLVLKRWRKKNVCTKQHMKYLNPLISKGFRMF